MIDWYNFIVQHNPTPAGFKTGKGNAYETPLRDKTHGRIYRVVYTKAKPEPPFTLKDATPEKLVETLKNHNMIWRLHAQRLLVERGKNDVVPALAKLIEDKSVDETGLNAGAVHALWTLACARRLTRSDEAAAKAVVAASHPPSVRRQTAIDRADRTSRITVARSCCRKRCSTSPTPGATGDIAGALRTTTPSAAGGRP